ncbi:MAG: hypothetical protein CL608_04000 [Anaerolineaceae bacterium]|nr:hypothetical protein [Anaerolineaceae bacterium]
MVLRHRPHEPELNKVIRWIAAEKPDLFNAYQQTQSKRLESSMQKLLQKGYIASFIGHEPRKALFIGLYSILDSTPLTYEDFWQIPAHRELKKFGLRGFSKDTDRKTVLWFNLLLSDLYKKWKGKLIVDWPSSERSWFRRAHRNTFSIRAILEESALDNAMPPWNEIVLTWKELQLIPGKWKSKLSEWRGIYYIFDTSCQKGYVGSAYGKENIFGRWLDYATTGHGGNRLLRQRDPRYFRFTILQRVSPDMDQTEIIKLENSWKQRLHTRKPYGLNEN